MKTRRPTERDRSNRQDLLGVPDARIHGRNPIPQAIRVILAASSSAALFASGAACANPHGGTVVAGSASINSPTPAQMLIEQTSSNAIINWQSFSIGSGQSVQFVQPSSSSATLNRVTGGSQSLIDGLLSANGQVLILNPEGVLFGRSARVNVGGLVATTSDIANDDFMTGKLAFHATGIPGASVVNEGSIHVADEGLAALVAPTVANSGVIEAHLGHIELASGETYTLDLYGDHLINFAIGQTAKTPTRSVDQSGQLIADGGQVLIASDSAAAVVSNVVNVSGVIQARTISTTQGGEIVLQAPGANITVTGRLDATGGAGLSGGIISVNGANVQVAASGSVDASASNQGNGGNIDLWGTNTLAVAGNVAARGGSQEGDGGSLDLSTAGGLSVTGSVDLQAPEGVAGSLLLDPASITVAAAGSSDPTASVVSAGFLDLQLQGGTNVSLSATDSITVNAPIDGRPAGSAASSHPSGSVSLTAGSLTIAAPIVTDRGAITLDATGVAASGSGNIIFTGSNTGTPSSGFLWVADCSAGCSNGMGTIGNAPIILNAGNGISFDPSALGTNGQLASAGPTTINAGGSVTLPALNGVKTASGGATGIGPLTITAGALVSLQGADVNGPIDITGNGITTGVSPVYSSSGGIELQAGSAGITVGAATSGGASPAAVQAGGGGNVALISSGAVNANSTIAATDGAVSITAAGDVNLDAGVVAGLISAGTLDPATIDVVAGGNVTVGGAPLLARDGITIGGQGANSTITLDAIPGSSAALIAGFGLTAGGAVDTGDIVNSSATINVLDAATVTLNSGILSASTVNVGATSAPIGSLTQTGSAVLQGGTADTGGEVSVYASGDVNIDNALTGPTGGVSLTSTAGSITVSQALVGINASGAASPGIGSLTISAGDNVLLNGATVGQSSAVPAGAGTVSVTADGTITIQGNTVLARDGITLTAGQQISLAAIGSSGGAALIAGTSSGPDGQPVAAIVALDGLTATSMPAISIDGGVRAQGGISIGTPNSRVGAITASGATLQAGDANTSPGSGLSIYAQNSVDLGPVLLGADGALLVDTYAADPNPAAYVALHNGIFGFTDSGGNPRGIGSVTINSEGSISLLGITANGNISLTAHGSAASIESGSDPVANGQGTLTAGGSISIEGGGGGNISFTQDGLPVSSTALLGGLDLYARTGSIQIGNASEVTLGGISAGTYLDVGNMLGAVTYVSIGTEVPGGQITTDTAGGSTGSQVIATANNPSLTVAGGPTGNANGTILLGPWFSGQAPPSGSSTPASSENITVQGAAVYTQGIAGAGSAVDYTTGTGTLIPVNSITLTASSTIGISGALAAANGITGTINAGGDMLLSGSVSSIGNGPISFGIPAATQYDCYAQSCIDPTYIFLDNNVFALGGGTITFNADVVVAGDPVDRNVADASGSLYIPPNFVPATFVGTASQPAPDPQNGDNIIAVASSLDSAGQAISTPQLHAPGGPAGCQYLACPSEADLTSLGGSGAVSALAQNGIVGADASGWANVFGSYNYTVSSTGGAVQFNGGVYQSSAALSNITQSMLKPITQCGSMQCPAPLAVYPVPETFQNVQLAVNAPSVTFEGPVGSSASNVLLVEEASDSSGNLLANTPACQQNPASCVQLQNPDGGPYRVDVQEYGIPVLGYFSILANVGNSGNPVNCVASCATAPTYLIYPTGLAEQGNLMSANAGNSGIYDNWNTTPTIVDVYYELTNGNPGQQDIGVVSNLNPSAALTGTQITALQSVGAFGSETPGAASGSGEDEISAAVGTGEAGVTLGDFGGDTLSVFAEASASGTESIDTSEARRSALSDSGSAGETGGEACRLGAGHTADLGLLPGVAGASANVFAQCRSRIFQVATGS